MKYPGIIIASLIMTIVCTTGTYSQQVSIDAKEVELKELYAVEYRLYAKEPIGRITIHNPTGERLHAKVILSGEKYVYAPMIITAELAAKQRTDIPLYIDLDMEVLDLGRQMEHIPVSIAISVYLGELEVFRPDVIIRHVTLHDRHKIPNGDPAKIAMFVDPDDKYVMAEATAGITGVNTTAEEKAAAAFGFLQKKGIYCIGSGGLQVQYPRELLRTKLGSIYDGALLYVTILESLDVETKLMFSSDAMLPLYKHQGKWYPVDLNMLTEDFEAARASGKELQDAMLARDVHAVTLREAWDRYPPLWFPVLESADMPLFTSATKDIEAGRLEDAARSLDQLLRKYPNSTVLLNNAANVQFLIGNMDKAMEKYALALNRAPDDGGLYLNMGIAHHKMGNDAKSMEFIRKAHTKLGSYMAMRSMLDLDDKDPACGEIDALLRQASQSTGISTVALASRRLMRFSYPLYWKRFHK